MRKTHIVCGDSPLCGSSGFGALAGSADCETCAKRMDAIALLLMDVAEGKDRQKQAAALVKKLRWQRAQPATEADAGGVGAGEGASA